MFDRPGRQAALLACVAVTLGTGCSNGRKSAVGESCSGTADCQDGLRCVKQVCIVPDGGTTRSCAEVTTELLNLLKQDCPTDTPMCGGNPQLDKPVVAYSERYYKLLQEWKRAGCPMGNQYLGASPVLCNPGTPRCPDLYQCVGTACQYTGS